MKSTLKSVADLDLSIYEVALEARSAADYYRLKRDLDGSRRSWTKTERCEEIVVYTFLILVLIFYNDLTTAALLVISTLCALNASGGDEGHVQSMTMLSLWLPLIAFFCSPRLHLSNESDIRSRLPQMIVLIDWIGQLPAVTVYFFLCLCLLIGLPSPVVGLVVGLVGRRDHNRVKFLIGFFLEVYGVFTWLFIIKKAPTAAQKQADLAAVQSRYANRIARLRSSRSPGFSEGLAAGGGHRYHYNTFSSDENLVFTGNHRLYSLEELRIQDYTRANPIRYSPNPDSIFPTTHFPTTTFLPNSVPTFSAGTFRGSAFLSPHTTVPCTIQSPFPAPEPLIFTRSRGICVPTIEENKNSGSDDEESLQPSSGISSNVGSVSPYW